MRSRARGHRWPRFGVAILAAALVAIAAARPSTSGGASPETQGAWSAVQDWPVIAIHSHVLPTGNVLAWGGLEESNYAPEVRLWNPTTGQFVGSFPNTRTNVFCAGHSFLPDGRLLVTGGHITPFRGVADINIFNPFSNTWSAGPTMNAPRWYPTNVTLPNGEVLIVAGTITKKKNNKIPQVLTTSGSLRTLSRAKRGLYTYPWMHLAPNGRVFMAGPDRSTAYLDTAGTGRWKTVGNRKVSNRREGSMAPYDVDRILVAGGGNNPTNTAEVIDLSAARPKWRKVSPMASRRRHLNLTTLPDGTVLASGGTSGKGFNNVRFPVLSAELWNPATERFTTLASMRTPRLYHSVAMLLPDARVLMAGGEGEGGPAQPNAEIFSPPYLFKGARPTISSTPSTVTYGQTFFVGTPDAGSIQKVTWIRLQSVTHSYNQDQRINRLTFTPSGGGLNVAAPADPRLAPPGHYMLFILNGSGVPSVSRIVRIS
ncbi:MAG: galactose oxidase-like domain-containing protein [Armatimonadota bacterium]